MPTDPAALTLDKLRDAVRGSAAAVRLRVRLQPAGGPNAKVFPPTYIGGVYATERRKVNGGIVECVLLDSVQSQANRLEQALLTAYRAERMRFPLITVAFPSESDGVSLADIGEVTTLDAPHRIYDAILRDSLTTGKTARPFRPQLKARGARDTADVSPEGRAIGGANSRNATPLFELCPTALVFGAWDSTGAAGGLGNKFARAVASEIVGFGAVYGVRTGGRLEPTGIEKGTVFEGEADASYVVDRSEARKDEDGEPVPFVRKEGSKQKGSPAEVNHGNIPPDLARYDWPGKEQTINTPDPLSPGSVVRKGNVKVGGVTFDYAEQTTVLSLAALRRLRFPPAGGEASETADLAARTVLAALALAAVAHQADPPDYFLRSNCQLVLEADPVFELVSGTNKVEPFALSGAEADALFAAAVAGAKAAGLPWREDKIVLTPKKALVDLVRRSRELGPAEGE